VSVGTQCLFLLGLTLLLSTMDIPNGNAQRDHFVKAAKYLYFLLKDNQKEIIQAGSELCHAQFKLGLAYQAIA
jgi:hypothetical protein